MKLGFLLSRAPPDYTWSMGRIWTEVLQTLGRRGHSLWIYHPVPWKAPSPRSTWEGATVVPVPCRYATRKEGGLRTDRVIAFEFPWRVGKVLEPSLDAMVASAEPGASFLFKAAHRHGTLAVDWWQGNIRYFLSTRQPHGWRDRVGLVLEKAILPPFVARHARIADLHVPPSTRNGQELIELYHIDPARVIPCLQGYTPWPPRTSEERRTARTELGLDPGGFYPVFVGADHVRKGLHVAREAVRLARAAQVPARLLHIGSTVENTAESLGFGWQTGEMRRRVLAAGDAFVYPTQYESSPMPAREAAALGLPVLTTEAACLEEGEPGKDYIIGRREDPRSFADPLIRMYREPAWAEELALRGQKLLSGRTFEVQAIDIERAIAKTLKEHPLRASPTA